MSVRPVLVILTGTVIPQVTIKEMPEDVLVLDRMDVPGIFRRAPTRINTEQVDAPLGQQRAQLGRPSAVWPRDSGGKS